MSKEPRIPWAQVNANEHELKTRADGANPIGVHWRPLAVKDLFPPRPGSRPTIYAYEDTNPQYAGLLKVGYTTVDVQSRVAQQYPTKRPGKPPYRIVLEEAAMRNDGTGYQYAFESPPGPEGANAKMKLFADSFIFAVEPGPGVGQYSDWRVKGFGSQDQAPIQINTPDRDFQHLVNPNYGDSIPYKYCGALPLGHRCMNAAGTDLRYSIAYNICREQTIEDVASGKRLYTRLADQMGMPEFDGNVWKSRIYGWRRGAYFCPSYGGREVTVLPAGEYAMDLTRTGGSYDWKLFDTGYKYLHCEAEETAGFNAGGIAALLAFGTAAMTWPVSPAWLAGSAFGEHGSFVFGTASAAFWGIDAHDYEIGAEDRAESVLYAKYMKAVWGSSSMVEYSVLGQDSQVGPGTRSGVADVGREGQYQVGETYEMFVELESVCSARLRIWALIDVSSEAKFYCTGNGEVSASQDWSTWRIRMKSY